MRIQKTCKTCSKEFTAIKEGQFFCSRKCFKKDYYKRNKARQEKLSKTRPTWTCSICNNQCEMPYDPTKHYSKYNEFACPFCGIQRKAIVDFDGDYRMVMGNSFTAQFVVQSAIVSSVQSLLSSQPS